MPQQEIMERSMSRPVKDYVQPLTMISYQGQTSVNRLQVVSHTAKI